MITKKDKDKGFGSLLSKPYKINIIGIPFKSSCVKYQYHNSHLGYQIQLGYLLE